MLAGDGSVFSSVLGFLNDLPGPPVGFPARGLSVAGTIMAVETAARARNVEMMFWVC